MLSLSFGIETSRLGNSGSTTGITLLQFSLNLVLSCSSIEYVFNIFIIFQIGFTGVRGNEYSGDIGLDDVTVYAGAC